MNDQKRAWQLSIWQIFLILSFNQKIWYKVLKYYKEKIIRPWPENFEYHLCMATLIRNILNYWTIEIYVWYSNVHPYAHTHTITYNEKSVYDVLRKQNEMLKWTDAEKMIVDRNCWILYTWEKGTKCTTNMHSCMPKLCINIMGINMIWQWLWYFLSSRLNVLNTFSR